MRQLEPETDNKRILVYMPALNEAATIGQVIRSVRQSSLSIESVDILVVDDGSTDETALIAVESGARVISHPINRGVGAAFQTAVEYALQHQYDFLVSTDADGQFPVERIQDLVLPLIEKKADFALGSRFLKPMTSKDRPQHMPFIKYWGNQKMSQLVSMLTGFSLKDVSCGFRAYSREALLHLNLFGQFTYTHEAILDLCHKGMKPKEIPIEVKYFEGRKSRVADSIGKYALRTSKIILRAYRDYRPLRFFGSIALFFFGLATLVGIPLGVHFILTGGVTPYKWLAALTLTHVLLGVVFVIVALVADMLDRNRRTQERILYIQKQLLYSKGEPERIINEVSS